MRPLHLQLAATVLLALCVWMILRQSGPHDSASGELPPPEQSTQAAHHAVRAVASLTTSAPRAEQPAPQAMHASAPAALGNVPHPPLADRNRLAATPAPDSGSNTLGRAIQLADNVQLPAVLMVQDRPTTTTPQLAAAISGIGDAFYQKLAASTAPGATSGTQDSAVIEPGPEVAQARDLANETYRALFGDEAYNRQTMNSVIEVQLPVTPGGGQP